MTSTCDKRKDVARIIKFSPDRAILKKRPSKVLRLVDYLSIRNRVAYYNGFNSDRIDIARNHEPFLYRMNLMKKLPVHDGCVNTICWNKTGEYILSGSDDCNLCITKPTYLFDTKNDYNVLHKIPTHHLGNIFSAQFIPGDTLLVSCSSEGPVIVHDINSTDPSQGLFSFNCHSSTIYEVVPLKDDDKVFISCGDDKTVRLFDMRCHKSCSRPGTCPHPALIRNSHAMTTLSIHPTNSNLLLVGRADGMGLVYDRRKLPNPANFSREKAHQEYLANRQVQLDNNEFRGSSSSQESTSSTISSYKYLHPLDGVVSQFTVPDMQERCRLTSLCYSPNGQQVLASYSQDYIYLFNHDNSSNIELIQTLPKKVSPNFTDINSQEDGNKRGEDNSNTSSNNDNNNTGSTNSERPNRFTTRTPRIRVRGDWSDTGINSIPYSARGNNNNSSQRATNILQRMTEVAFSLSIRGGTNRPVPLSELIAGPTEYVADLRPNEDDDDDEEDIDDNEDEQDDDESNDEAMDENKDEDSDQEDNESIKIREELRDTFDSTSKDQKDSNSGNSRHETCDRSSSDANSSSGGKTRRQISEQTKLKFKNTFSELKNRFSNITTYHPHVKYQGHRNCRTSIKEAIFWGDNYIMSGSDCGRIMIWEKDTAKLVMCFPADERVVNCLAANPNHYVLASSGIDYDIKLWSTQNLLDCPLKVGSKEMDEIVRNNEIMLEEAKQTITVPPHLFFRVLASIGINRSNRGRRT